MAVKDWRTALPASFLLALALAASTAAHAKLVRAEPAPGAVLRTPPRAVRLVFNEELASQGSTVAVVDARGRRVDDGRGGLDLGDLHRTGAVHLHGEAVRARTVLVACAAWLALSAPALAHGILRSASPAHGANLDSAPREVVLTFSEPVHPQASSAEVLDSQGRVVSEGQEVTQDGRTLRVRVGQLPRGTYTVRWKVVSQVDGHTTSGFLSFGVRATPPASGAGVEAPPWWQVLLRWLAYLSALTLAGTLAFGELILPAAGATKHWVRLRPLRDASAVALAAVAVVDLVLRAAWLRPPGHTLVEAARVLATSPVEGRSLLLRVGSAALAAGLAPGSPRGLVLVPAAAALLGLTLTSHAWGAGPLAALSDWLHLAAASVWVGGLPALALLARLRDPQGTQAIARAFSRWAGYALAVVVATGLYASALHVPSWRA